MSDPFLYALFIQGDTNVIFTLDGLDSISSINTNLLTGTYSILGNTTPSPVNISFISSIASPNFSGKYLNTYTIDLISSPFQNQTTYIFKIYYNRYSEPSYQKDSDPFVYFGIPEIPSPYYQSYFLNNIYSVVTNPGEDNVTEYQLTLTEVGSSSPPIIKNILPTYYDQDEEPELYDKTSCLYENINATVNTFYLISICAKNSRGYSSPCILNAYTVNYSSPPTITNVEYFDQSVQMTYEPPVYTGGNNAPLIGIFAEVSSLYSTYTMDESRIHYLSNNKISFDFSNLNYGRDYIIQLYAENEAGNSEYVSRTVIPKIIPSSPRIVNIDPRNRQITVTYFVIPNSDVCFIQYYLTNNNTGIREVPITEIYATQGIESSFTIPCAKNANTYILTIRLINEVGTSPYSYYITTTYEDLLEYNKLTQRNGLNAACSLSQKQLYANRIRNPGRMIQRSYRGFM